MGSLSFGLLTIHPCDEKTFSVTICVGRHVQCLSSAICVGTFVRSGYPGRMSYDFDVAEEGPSRHQRREKRDTGEFFVRTHPRLVSHPGVPTRVHAQQSASWRKTQLPEFDHQPLPSRISFMKGVLFGIWIRKIIYSVIDSSEKHISKERPRLHSCVMDRSRFPLGTIRTRSQSRKGT